MGPNSSMTFNTELCRCVKYSPSEWIPTKRHVSKGYRLLKAYYHPHTQCGSYIAAEAHYLKKASAVYF